MSSAPLLTAAAAGALAVRAAASATAVAVRVADELAAALPARLSREAELNEWHMTAADAIGLNAAIRMVAAEAGRLGVPVDLPARIELEGRTVTEMRAWLADTASRVGAARAAVVDAVGAEARRRMLIDLPVAQDSRAAVAEALAAYHATLRARAAAAPVPPPPAGDTARQAQEVLLQLHPDVLEADRELVLRQAALLAGTAGGEASMHLSTLRKRVTEANRRAGERRLAAQWLEALDRPGTAGPAQAATARALHDVVAGTAGLTAGLRTQARAALDVAVVLTAARYRREVVHEMLTGLGYAVAAQDAAGSAGHLSVGHVDWAGEQTAEVWIDADGGVHFRLDRVTGAAGDVVLARNADREAALAAHLGEVVHEMLHRGIAGAVAHAHRTQQAPLADAQTPEQRQQPHHGQRAREAGPSGSSARR